MLPARNRRDFEDIPEEVRGALEFVWLERVEEAAAFALEPVSDSEKSTPSAAAA
jgi:ATP-dependent Lon protease